jgi:peptide/nickel transport system permease protein
LDNKTKKRAYSNIKYTLNRIIGLIPLMLFVSLAVFVMLSLAPGDPAMLILGVDATPEKVFELRERLGLNDPLYIQYYNFIKDLVFKGDLGKSYQTGRPVVEEIQRTLPISMQLAVYGTILSIFVSILIGVISAVKQYSAIDMITKIVVMLGVSMPVFLIGLILIIIFSLKLSWFPSSGWGSIKHMILPVISISAYPTAALTRLTRSSMLDVIRQNYIRTAKSKGLSELAVISKHALKNACLPVITMIGVQLGILIGGSILTETVFAIPGLGSLTVTAVYARDYAIIRGSILVVAVIVAIINLIVDLLYTLFDPRISY